jgi:hypothetical protein
VKLSGLALQYIVRAPVRNTPGDAPGVFLLGACFFWATPCGYISSKRKTAALFLIGAVFIMQLFLITARRPCCAAQLLALCELPPPRPPTPPPPVIVRLPLCTSY